MCVCVQGLPTAIVKVFIELNTSVTAVTRGDQKSMKKAVSGVCVCFVDLLVCMRRVCMLRVVVPVLLLRCVLWV